MTGYERPTLKGDLTGASRKELVTKATTLGEAYFGTPCVIVRLLDEKPHPILSGFAAKFEAQVHHDVEARSYGPGICRGCKAQDWPQNPLTRGKWAS